MWLLSFVLFFLLLDSRTTMMLRRQLFTFPTVEKKSHSSHLLYRRLMLTAGRPTIHSFIDNYRISTNIPIGSSNNLVTCSAHLAHSAPSTTL